MRLTRYSNYRFVRPPTRLRKAKLDNIALVPATLLFYKDEYRAIANGLPTGSVLICTPYQSKQRKTLESVASYFSEHRHNVTMIPVGKVINMFSGSPAVTSNLLTSIGILR